VGAAPWVRVAGCRVPDAGPRTPGALSLSLGSDLPDGCGTGRGGWAAGTGLDAEGLEFVIGLFGSYQITTRIVAWRIWGRFS
jgi:hypothetical protein